MVKHMLKQCTAIYNGDKDLAVNIASGLIGYLGRGKVTNNKE